MYLPWYVPNAENKPGYTLLYLSYSITLRADILFPHFYWWDFHYIPHWLTTLPGCPIPTSAMPTEHAVCFLHGSSSSQWRWWHNNPFEHQELLTKGDSTTSQIPSIVSNTTVRNSVFQGDKRLQPVMPRSITTCDSQYLTLIYTLKSIIQYTIWKHVKTMKIMHY